MRNEELEREMQLIDFNIQYWTFDISFFPSSFLCFSFLILHFFALCLLPTAYCLLLNRLHNHFRMYSAILNKPHMGIHPTAHHPGQVNIG